MNTASKNEELNIIKNVKDSIKEIDLKEIGNQDLSIINACARKGYKAYMYLSWDKTTFTSRAAMATLTIAGATAIRTNSFDC